MQLGRYAKKAALRGSYGVPRTGWVLRDFSVGPYPGPNSRNEPRTIPVAIRRTDRLSKGVPFEDAKVTDTDGFHTGF